MFQEQLSACFKNACPDNKRLHVRIIQESCPDVTRIINRVYSTLSIIRNSDVQLLNLKRIKDKVYKDIILQTTPTELLCAYFIIPKALVVSIIIVNILLSANSI